MTTPTRQELERQLQEVFSELQRTNTRLQTLESAQARGTARTKLLRSATLVLGGLLALGAWLPRAEVRAADEPTVVTVLQLPVVFHDKSGHTLMEVSDRPQHHGITLYSKTGEAAYIGVDKQSNGVLMLETAAGKISSEMSVDGFHLFGSSGKSVAFMGAESTGAGVIQLKNAADGVVVDIGALGGKTGFVQVYPRSGKAPFPIPNYLQGGK